MTPSRSSNHHHNADADDPEVVPSHWRKGGPITLASDTDAVLESSGAVPLLAQATSLLRSEGRLGLVALYKSGLELIVNDWVARELEILGCYGYHDKFAGALAMVTADPARALAMVTASYPLDDIVGAFSAQADVQRHVKVQIRPQG